jgi:hypothetical protein
LIQASLLAIIVLAAICSLKRKIYSWNTVHTGFSRAEIMLPDLANRY